MTTTITCCVQMPGAVAAKIGIANQTTSNVKCRMMAGSNPNQR